MRRGVKKTLSLAGESWDYRMTLQKSQDRKKMNHGISHRTWRTCRQFCINHIRSSGLEARKKKGHCVGDVKVVGILQEMDSVENGHRI